MILLTDSELLDIYDPHLWEEGNTWREVGHWVAKAQLRKMHCKIESMVADGFCPAEILETMAKETEGA